MPQIDHAVALYDVRDVREFMARLKCLRTLDKIDRFVCDANDVITFSRRFLRPCINLQAYERMRNVIKTI